MKYKFEDIIEEVDEYNSDLKYGLEDIIGVTIEKGLIPTIANLTQTNLEKFYIVKKNTFIYNHTLRRNHNLIHFKTSVQIWIFTICQIIHFTNNLTFSKYSLFHKNI